MEMILGETQQRFQVRHLSHTTMWTLDRTSTVESNVEVMILATSTHTPRLLFVLYRCAHVEDYR
jgi:hypothetical protein